MSASMSAATKQTPQLQAALYYAGLGWSVVPAHRSFKMTDGTASCSCKDGTACISKGKHPAVAWTTFQQRRASDAEILAWFNGQYADYGVGIITGQVSGFFAVDIDQGPGKEGGETIANLQLIHDDLPHTIEAQTGGGGRHVLLRHPGAGHYVPTAKNVLGPGVDVRGDGGFIVAAPSFHESGRKYLWAQHAHPRTTPVAEAPEWLLEMVEGPAPDSPNATGPRAASTGSGEIIRDEWGKVTDGRERWLVGVVCGVIAEMLRRNGTLPSVDEVFAEAWPTYERTTRARGTSLDADNRGQALMRQRIGHMLRRAASGKWKVQLSENTGQLPPPHPTSYDVDPETGEVRPIETRAELVATPIEELDLDNIPPRKWVYGRELVRYYVSVLASPGGTGKTAYTLAVAVAIVTGKPLLSPDRTSPPPWAKVHKPGRVWIYNLEDPMEEMRRRVKATLDHYGITQAEVSGLLFVNSGRDFPLVIVQRDNSGNLIVAPVVEALVAELRRRQVDVLIIDPFVQSHSAEENRNEEMNLVMALWARVAQMAGCAVWLVHHFRKGGKGGDAESIRGAGAIQGAARSMFTMSVMSPEEADKLGVQPEDRWQYVRHDNAKQNMAPPAAHAVWYRLASVHLKNGDEDYPEGDYVQAVEAWAPPSPWEGLPWGIIERVMNRLEKGPSEGEFYAFGKQSKDRWAGRLLAEEAGMTDGQAALVLKSWKENGVLEEGQYASPRQKGALTGCVRVNAQKLGEMRLAFPTKDSVDE